MSVLKSRYAKSQIEYERYSVLAVSSIYGIDILQDNVEDCRNRFFEIFNKHYTLLFKDQCKEECRKSVQYLLVKNILFVMNSLMNRGISIMKKYNTHGKMVNVFFAGRVRMFTSAKRYWKPMPIILYIQKNLRRFLI
jgi:hypothetical protein